MNYGNAYFNLIFLTQQFNTSFTWEKCRNQWRYHYGKFKEYVDNQKKTGTGQKKEPSFFEEVYEITKNTHGVVPGSMVQTSLQPRTSQLEISTSPVEPHSSVSSQPSSQPQLSPSQDENLPDLECVQPQPSIRPSIIGTLVNTTAAMSLQSTLTTSLRSSLVQERRIFQQPSKFMRISSTEPSKRVVYPYNTAIQSEQLARKPQCAPLQQTQQLHLNQHSHSSQNVPSLRVQQLNRPRHSVQQHKQPSLRADRPPLRIIHPTPAIPNTARPLHATSTSATINVPQRSVTPNRMSTRPSMSRIITSSSSREVAVYVPPPHQNQTAQSSPSTSGQVLPPHVVGGLFCMFFDNFR